MMQIQTPDWVKHAVFYQIFPDRFALGQRSEPLLNGVPWEDWNSLPTLQGYKGGNLWGVIEQLDYLQGLGITAIYFTPIFQSTCNHRYHTHDYYQVDPILGGNEALRSLLDAAHQRQIKVVLDGVFNHASRGFFQFNDILENGPHSPWLDWFRIQGWPLSAYDGSLPAHYDGWAGNRALPVFNHDHPDVREYIMNIAEYWIQFGIDGWRLDVPFEIKAEGFWQEFRDRVKALNPDAYIVGEIWGDSRHWLDGTQFDGVMNYLFTEATIAFTAGDRVIMEYVEPPSYQPYPALSASAYGDKIQHLLNLYPWEIQLTQLNLLASHDTARLMTIVGGDRASIELATLLLLTFPGSPSIYYGDEVGLPGGLDPDCRRSFPPESNWDQTLLDFHRRLIAVRHTYPALRTGQYQILSTQTLYVFARILDTQSILIAINPSPESQQFRLDITDAALPLQPNQQVFGTASLQWSTDGSEILALELPPRSGCILVNQQ
jgi:cyclomaltodextrinase / maltogenic alpha-amylase / neopullulanase